MERRDKNNPVYQSIQFDSKRKPGKMGRNSGVRKSMQQLQERKVIKLVKSNSLLLSPFKAAKRTLDPTKEGQHPRGHPQAQDNKVSQHCGLLDLQGFNCSN